MSVHPIKRVVCFENDISLILSLGFQGEVLLQRGARESSHPANDIAGNGSIRSFIDHPIEVIKEATQELTVRISNKVSSILADLTKSEAEPVGVANYQPRHDLQSCYVRMGSESASVAMEQVSQPLSHAQSAGDFRAGLTPAAAPNEASSIGNAPNEASSIGNPVAASSSTGGSAAAFQTSAAAFQTSPLHDKRLVVCTGCRRQLSYPQAATAIQCVMCRTIMTVGGPNLSPATRCCRCPTVFPWPPGAQQVRAGLEARVRPNTERDRQADMQAGTQARRQEAREGGLARGCTERGSGEGSGPFAAVPAREPGL